MAELNDISKGVADAWDFWLSQHDISTPEVIGDAIKDSFASWLEEHEEELLAAIAARVAEAAGR